MPAPIIQADQLSKSFVIQHESRERYTALRDVLSNNAKKIISLSGSTASKKHTTKEEFWALKNVNFQIAAGERIGIVGRNGAGKSTLLKIISRITEPTSGTVKIKGRVASLLEVGTGFHPELTGKENIFLNGAILGMSRKEIKQKFDEIVDFAEVEQFLDTPVKRYSSGMYVRLAFAVAAHLEPEILVVDEVLAVGDAQFQSKCLGKMEEVSRGHGRTILFVSHNMAAIRSLCDRGILLSKGVLTVDDSISHCINEYEAIVNANESSFWINDEMQLGEVYLESVHVLDEAYKPHKYFLNTEKVIIRIVVKTSKNADSIKLGFDLINKGSIVFRSQQVDTCNTDELEGNVRATFDCEIPAGFLNAGTYSIKPLLSLHLIKGLTKVNESIISFTVTFDSANNPYQTVLTENNHPGFIFPQLKWSFADENRF